MADLTQEFEEAASAVSSLQKDPGNETKLRLYALYKQGTNGDVEGKRPGITNPVGRAKYDAWSQLAGTSREDAMRRYVDLARTLTG